MQSLAFPQGRLLLWSQQKQASGHRISSPHPASRVISQQELDNVTLPPQKPQPHLQPHFGQDTPNPQFSHLAPLVGTIVQKTKINQNPNQQVAHLSIDVRNQGLEIKEGQSIGVIPPSLDPNWIRYYSVSGIERDRQGNVKKLDLCVKRYVFQDAQGRETQRGLASNYLCNLRPGEKLNLYGPFGDVLTPPPEADANLLMIATGTGVASYRAILRHRYTERAHEQGQTHLIFGESSPEDLFYQSEFEAYRNQPGYTFTPVLSKTDGQRVQDYIRANPEKIMALLKDPKTYVYLCGHNSIETGIKEAFADVCQQMGENWTDVFSRLQQSGRWRCETKPVFWNDLRRAGLSEYAPPLSTQGKDLLIKNDRKNRWPLFA